MTFIRLSDSEIKKLAAADFSIDKETQAEMAIPTYQHKNPLVRWLFWKRYYYAAQLLELEPTGNMTVLEFGCGMGIFLPTLCSISKKVYAVDLFPQYAQKLADLKGLDVTFIEAVDQAPDASFDCIVAADVLEHLEQPHQYMELFKKKLKKNGTLIVTGPTESIIYALGRFVAVRFRQIPEEFEEVEVKAGHHHTNINQLKNIITDCGFILEEQRKLPFTIPPYLFKIFKFRNH